MFHLNYVLCDLELSLIPARTAQKECLHSVWRFSFSPNLNISRFSNSSLLCPRSRQSALFRSTLKTLIWMPIVYARHWGNKVDKNHKNHLFKKLLALHSDKLEKTHDNHLSNMTVLIIAIHKLFNLTSDFKNQQIQSLFLFIDVYVSSVWWFFYVLLTSLAVFKRCSKAVWVHDGSCRWNMAFCNHWSGHQLFDLPWTCLSSLEDFIQFVSFSFKTVIVTLVLAFHFLDQNVFLHSYLHFF